MSRKKIMKLLIGMMTAVVLSTGIANLGQAVYANANVNEIAVGTTRQAITTAEELKSFLNATNTATIGTISTEIELTSEMINLINALSSLKTLEINSGGYLTVSGDAKIVKQNLKITRGTSTAALLKVVDAKETPAPPTGEGGTTPEAQKPENGENTKPEGENGSNSETQKPEESKPASRATTPGTPETEVKTQIEISGFVFGNPEVNGSTTTTVTAPIIENTSTAITNVNLVSNTLTGSGHLVDSRTGFTFSGNSFYGKASLLKATAVDVSVTSLNIGGGVFNISGKVTPANIISGKLYLLDSKNQPKPDKNGVDLKFSATNNEFTGQVTSVSNSETYQIYVTLVDGDGNSFIRNLGSIQGAELTIDIVSVTHNSVKIKVTNNLDSAKVKYPLTFELLRGNSLLNQVEIKETDISKISNFDITNLDSNTNYTVRFKDADLNLLAEKPFTTRANGTISGGSNSITGNGSTNSNDGSISTSDINKSTINDIDASINVGSTTLSNSLKDGTNFKTNYEGVTATYTNGKLNFNGLVPGKNYKDLTLTYTDKNSKNKTVKLPAFTTKAATTKLREFIVDVYKYSLDRQADERGFAYWEDQLKNKRISADLFVSNLLNEREFLTKHTTTSDRIKGLYQVIVNRAADASGLSFWSTKYEDLVKLGYTDSVSLGLIASQMVNEAEFKNRISSLGI